MENTATLEVNGRRYDAVTGTILGPGSAPQIGHTGHNIDGFFRPRTSTTPRFAKTTATLSSTTKPSLRDVIAAPAKPVSKPQREAASRGVNHTRAHLPQSAAKRNITVDHAQSKTQAIAVRRGEPNHVRHHAAQHSRTLRRDTVPAPMPNTHNALRPHNALQHKTPSLIALKKSAAAVDPSRLARAQNISKSPLVAHHHAAVVAVAGLTPTLAPLAVQPIPTTQTVPVPKPSNDSEPVPPPQQGNQPSDMFEQALTRANNYVDMKAHTARYKQKARIHIASMVSGSLALIIIAAVVAYQNSPAMQVKVAAFRSGVSVGAPDLATAGFKYNGARAGDGKLTLGYKGPDGVYQLTQANTNLSDVDMIQSIGSTDASGTPTYQVVMAGNTMVYRFDNTSATWVSNGEWYTLSANHPVTNQQVKSVVQRT